MRFGEIITAVATLVVVDVLVDFGLMAALVPNMDASMGSLIASIASLLVASLVVGYVFAGQIREESRMGAIGRILVLGTVVFMFAALIMPAAIEHYNLKTRDELQSMLSLSDATSNLTWFAFEEMMLIVLVGLNVILVLVFGFIGLYVGSMRKVSAKT